MNLTKQQFFTERKGISTIIATIIIVSVSIVMAIAVAYWVMGVGNSFTKFERIEFLSIYADYNPTVPAVPERNITDSVTNETVTIPGSPGIPANYSISVVLKNTGSAAATINNIFVNGRPYDRGYNHTVTQEKIVGEYLAAGASTPEGAMIYLPDIPDGYFSHGNSVDVSFQTAAGRSYSNTVVLP